MISPFSTFWLFGVSPFLRTRGWVYGPLNNSFARVAKAYMAPYTSFSRLRMISSTSQWNQRQVTGEGVLTPRFDMIRMRAVYSLFNVVVDTDQVASELIKLLSDKKGRLTFMPLNRIRREAPPPINAQDAIPLIDKLRFDPKFLPAIQQVFGKMHVCRDLTIAAAYVKSHGINTITLDGDQVDRRGAITGGYVDIRRSRIEAINNLSSWRAKHAADEQRLREVSATIRQLDQDITRVTGRIQVLTNEQAKAKATRAQMTEEASSFIRERERLVTRIEKLEGDIYELEAELSGLDAKLQGYRTEMASPLAQGLTADEEELIEELGKEVEQRQRQLLEFAEQKNEVCLLLYYAITSIGSFCYFTAGKSQEHTGDRAQREPSSPSRRTSQ